MQIRTKELFTLSETIAASYLEEFEFPWEALSSLKEYIVKLGNTLDPEIYEQKEEHIWIARNAKISSSANLNGPLIIDEEAEIRHCAYIRGSVIVGKKAVVGNSTELKNVVLFNQVQVPHYNYVGDSILGFKSHMGAGSITSNVKSDKSLVQIKHEGEVLETNQKKVGSFLGDFVEVGCNSVLNPGTVIGKESSVYPGSIVRGCVAEYSIFKSSDNVIKKISK
jgi:UDP-N-acetylglucosamine diphosphorylase / glucose-1-phosphate thymidylyltransferase / UDP-N-acetylgalactosamine diphosphorylase / glucosamine-1-phosphate N-acetyltransferase / galactosamine-1-phosphate N-acetyltransferase